MLAIIRQQLCRWLLCAVFFVYCCGYNNAMAQNDNIVDVETDYLDLFYKLMNYANLSPMDRAALLLASESERDNYPDMALVLKDLRAVFGVGMDSSAFSLDPPQPVQDSSLVRAYYATLSSINIDYTDQPLFYAPLPQDVKESVYHIISTMGICPTSSNADETHSGDGTATDGNAVVDLSQCRLSHSLMLALANLYFSLNAIERVAFYRYYGDSESSNDTVQLFNNITKAYISDNITFDFSTFIIGSDVLKIDDATGSLNGNIGGMLQGVFTIDANGTTCRFSRGNLQYYPSSNTWRFAENQYDYIGAANSNIAETYEGWIDLFGWGTSGEGTSYPYLSVSSSSSYGPSDNSSLNEETEYDWGVHNAISNGGDDVNIWRTLTMSQWDYLLNQRQNGTDATDVYRYAKSTVNGVSGVILFPDGFSPSDILSVNSPNTSTATYSSNTISQSQWVEFEAAGCVFLPAAGIRNDTSISNMGSRGYYWSATQYPNTNGYRPQAFLFSDSLLYAYYGQQKYLGLSVRLVRVYSSDTTTQPSATETGETSTQTQSSTEGQ